MDKCHKIVFFLGAVLLVLGVLLVWIGTHREKNWEYHYSEEVFGNPLMGYAVPAWYEKISEDIQLLYVDITWKELEPEEGRYDWERIEKENQLLRWKQEGKHIVLRFVCDIPERERHLDIPNWLYEKTGDGDWYDMEYGLGYAPNYENEVFRAAHKRAIQALGEYFSKDGFLSYVELGSLGHWGEWHVNYAAGIRRLPKESIRNQYVEDYIEAFPNKKLLMRRPFRIAGERGLGLYNDMTGDKESTEEWLSWIREGGDFRQTKEKNALVPMDNVWNTAPLGGELTSSLSMEELLSEHLEDSLDMIRSSHQSFLGPKIPDPEYSLGYQRILGELGYRIWISQLSMKERGDKLILSLDWNNQGNAAFYENWPIFLYVKDKEGKEIEKAAVELQLSELIPAGSLQSRTVLSGYSIKDFEKEGYQLELGIVDPMTEQPAIRLAMSAAQKNERVKLI